MRRREPARIYLAVLAAVGLLAGACASRSSDQAATTGVPGAVEQPAASPIQEEAPQAPETAPDASASATESGGAPAASGASSAPIGGASSAAPKTSSGAGAQAPKAKGNAAAGTKSPSTPAQGAAAPNTPSGGSSGGGAAPAASGGTKGKFTDSVTVTGPNSQGVTDKEIKVGVLAPLSGYAAFLGEVEVDAVKAFLFDANAKGGANGKQYRIVVADTRFEPATEAVGARRLVEQEKVFALFTTFSDTIGPYIASKGIPNFAFGIVPPAFSSKYPTIYPVGLDTVDSITQMAYTLTQVLKKPIKSVAIAYGTQNIAWGPWADYAKKAWEQFGVEVKSMDRFNVSDGDCTQLVLKIQNLKVDFWQVGNTLGFPLCGQAMYRQGYKPPQGFGGPYTDDINWGNQMGPGFDGVFAMTNGVSLAPGLKGTPWPYDASGVAPEVDHYIDSMKRFSAKSGNISDMEGIWPQSFWAQAKLLHDAVLRQTDAVTWQGVNKWIQGQKNWSSGLVSPGSFDPKCKTGGVQTYIYSYKWNAQANTVEEIDWKQFGGVVKIPTEVKNKVFPGAGDCYLTAYADSKL